MLFVLLWAWNKEKFCFYYLTIVAIADMLPGIMGNQENIMAIGNTGPKTPSDLRQTLTTIQWCRYVTFMFKDQ